MAAASPPGANNTFARILWGIGAGILCGLFLGESVRPLGLVATGFIRLLQVNVLPYLLGSLIYSLGSRGSAEIKRIAGWGGLFLVLVWGLTLLLVVLCPLALPPFSGVPVFSIAEAPPSFDWLDLYIPANLFHALANNLIPAVVLFGILAGLALGQVADDRKAELLRVLEALNEAMARVSRMIVRLTPFGLFAIAAVTAGEVRLEDLLRLQVWFFFYAGGALVLTLFVLPTLVDRFTHVRYGRFLREMRGAIVTAAAAGDVLVVLPLIAEAEKELLVESGTPPAQAESAVGIAVPLLYNFPHAGKILSLAFLPFAAWYSGSSLRPHQVALLITAGPLSLFGSINAAMPFLLDILRLPADLFRLFTISSLINTRFGSMVAAAHLAALALVVSAAILGGVEVRVRRVLRFLLVCAAVLIGFLAATRVFFTWLLPPTPHGLETLSGFELRPPLAPVTRAGRDPAEARPVPGQRLREVQRRGLLRVGYFSDGMPWAFVNAKGELVGHDVEAAHRFATQLGLGLEFVPVKRADPALSRALDEGVVDVIMTGMTATLARAERMSLSHPYAQEHMGFLAHDHDRDRFSSLVNLAAGEGLVIAVPPVESASDFVKGLLPAATIRAYESVDEAIADAEVSAILTSLERAYYWSRVRPELCAVMPEGAATAANAVYAVPRGEQELQGLVDLWIDTRRASGEEEEAYTYWVRGRALAPRAPRWSVLHDVLGWRGR